MSNYRILNFLFISVLLLINSSLFADPLDTNKKLILEGKTLYIDKDDPYMTDTLLNAFEKYWTITKIKYVDKDELIENLTDDGALNLILFKKEYDNGIEVREHYFYQVVFGHSRVKLLESLVKYSFGDAVGMEKYLKVGGNSENSKKHVAYNINDKAPLYVKSTQSNILVDNDLITYSNEENIKGNTYKIGLAEVQKKTLYISKSAVPKNFNLIKFCKFNMLDSSNVKVITNEELSEIIYSNEDALILFNIKENSDYIYQSSKSTNEFCFSNTTGEEVCLLTTSGYMYLPPTTSYVLYMLLVIGILVGAIVANT